MRLLIYIICCSLGASLAAQRIESSGTVFDSISNQPLHGAHIINLSTHKFTISDPGGRFFIPTQIGDTIRISYVGYESQEISVTRKTSFAVKLSLAAIELDEVQVSIFPEYHRFKELIINTEPVDSAVTIHGIAEIPLDAYPIPVNERDVLPPDYHAPTFKVGFDLGGFTKSSKEKKKMEKILARQELERAAYRKFNREWIASETKLEGDELTNFIAYCKFTTQYLAETSLFEIKERMMVLLEEFQSKQNESDDNRYSPGA